jgi:hypothetical protein
MYLAPGASQGARVDCPGADEPAGQARQRPSHEPSVDEHLVEPETRWEVIDGARVQASPAQPPHADQHFTLDYVLGAHLAPGYVGATDLLTRWSEDDDYATDTSVRRTGIDEATGERHLEELAFEVAFTQRRAALAERARKLTARGVRRVFAIFVVEDGDGTVETGGTVEKGSTVEEWTDEQTWQPLDLDGVIEDPCLAVPLRVRALLDVDAADDAVARALIARGHPVVLAFGDECYRRGLVEGRRKALRRLLAERGIELEARHLARIEACTDPDVLKIWVRRSLTAEHADAVLELPA